MNHIISKRETDDLLESLGALKLCDLQRGGVYGEDIDLAIKIVKEYRTLKLMKRPLLEWVKCKRKKGTEFLKLVYYCPDAGGNIEAGRFNMSKTEKPHQDWTIEEILNEIKNY